jgi:hypothetical protein
VTLSHKRLPATEAATGYGTYIQVFFYNTCPGARLGLAMYRSLRAGHPQAEQNPNADGCKVSEFRRIAVSLVP